jgi:signal transduction histidine kinase
MKERLEKRVTSPQKPGMWYWVPAAVLLIGISSIPLFLWVNRIAEKQRMDALVVAALMDVQIKAATGHLWVEEAVSGDDTADEALAELDQAIKLVNVALNGGESDHGSVSAPLKDPQVRAQAETIKSLLMKFRMLGADRLQNPEESGIASAFDQQFDAVFKEILGKAAALEALIQKNSAADRARSGRLFLGLLSAWAFIVTAATAGLWIHVRARKRAEGALVKANGELLVQAEELKERTKQLSEAQEELLHKEKLSILGQLSGSVGHELRNPLGVMNNAVYFLKTVLAEGDETIREYLEIIENEIRNSQRIISDLLDFARTKPPQTKVVTASELVEQSLGRCAVPENVALKREVPETLPLLKVDPLQMGQVLTNLVTNAVQAMPDGGALNIRARTVGAGLAPAQSGYPQGVPLQDFIAISVEDTGEGIAPENMKKLFQPLFTTKPKGIGLGLVVCRNLTEANGGRIEVASRLGEGTAFTVILPVEEGKI